MTIDARIPLLSNLDTVTAENNQQRNRLATLALAQQQENRIAKSQDLSNQNTQQEIIAKKLENLSAKDKYNLTEEVHAAAQLKALSGDPEAQRQFLGDRIGNYESRVASGQMSAQEADPHIRLSQHALGLLDTPEGQQQLSNGIDQYINLGKQAGILKDPKEGSISIFNGGTQSMDNSGQDNNMTGDAYLQTIKDPRLAAVIKMVGDGNEKSATVLGRMKAEDRMTVLAGVAKYNPNYNSNQNAAMAEFGFKKLGNTVRSLNVASSHLNTLSQLADALDNGNIKAFNEIGNKFASETGNAAPTDFNAAKQMVADEIVKAVVGAGGGVSDREEAAKTISDANSPAQLKGVINTYKSLLGGQLKGLQLQYERSTGKTDFNKFLTPETMTEQSPQKSAAPTDIKSLSDDDLKKMLGI